MDNDAILLLCCIFTLCVDIILTIIIILAVHFYLEVVNSLLNNFITCIFVLSHKYVL